MKEKEIEPSEIAATETPVSETPVAAEAAPEPPMNPVLARMKSKGHNFENDDEGYGLADRYIAELEDYKGANEADNQKIIDALDAEPVLAKIIQDIVSGVPIRASLAMHFDPEDLVAQEGDPDYEAYSANVSKRKEEMKKRKEWEDTIAKNGEMSMKEVEAYAAETGRTPEQIVEVLNKGEEVLSDLYNGLISRKVLTLLETAFNAGAKEAAAREEGMIAGRNAKIEAEVMPEKVGDGLPKIQASEDVAEASMPPKKKKGYIESLMGGDA